MSWSVCLGESHPAAPFNGCVVRRLERMGTGSRSLSWRPRKPCQLSSGNRTSPCRHCPSQRQVWSYDPWFQGQLVRPLPLSSDPLAGSNGTWFLDCNYASSTTPPFSTRHPTSEQLPTTMECFHGFRCGKTQDPPRMATHTHIRYGS